MPNKIINEKILNNLQEAQMRDDLPTFKAGDTVSVYSKIVEGNKTRVQVYTGVVLKIRGGGTSRSFIVRKESGNLGVEVTFSYHSPSIIKIEVIKRGKVRRAYISYMRERSGKSARIKTANTKKEK